MMTSSEFTLWSSRDSRAGLRSVFTEAVQGGSSQTVRAVMSADDVTAIRGTFRESRLRS